MPRHAWVWGLVLVGTLAGGCHEEKGLFGLTLGMAEGAVEGAFRPAVPGGSWARQRDTLRIASEGALPAEAVVYLKDGVVVGLRLRVTREGIVAADENPITYPERLRARQVPDGAKGPFEYGAMKMWLGPRRVLGFAREGDRTTLERWSRSALGVEGEGCEAAARWIERLEAGLAETFGPGGARRVRERKAAIVRLRPLAAAAELTCPESSGVRTAVADLFRLGGRANGARERYLQALKAKQAWFSLGPADAHAGLGALALRYRKPEEAATHYRLALERAGDAGHRARIARAWADKLHARERWGEAARAYQIYLENTASTDAADLSLVHARLTRDLIEQPGGCAKAAPIAAKGLALEGVPDRPRAAMLAAEAFRIIACDPKHKKRGYARLKEAVRLDPLMAAEWSRLTAYYDREAQDETVLRIMVEQGWLDPRGLEVARAYQRELRDEVRSGE